MQSRANKKDESDRLKIANPPVIESEIIKNPFVKQYILLGYAAKGTIYFLIGMLAIEAAILPERKAAGTYTALKHLSGQPLGSVLLCILAVTLTGYVWRRLLQAVRYPGHSENFSLKAVFQRLGYIMSSLSYAGVAYSACDIVFGLGKYNDTIKHLVKKLFEQQIGEWIVFFGGLGVFGIGLGYIYGAYTGSYISDFVLSSREVKNYVKIMGKIGVTARGVAFIVTGWCLVFASLFSDANLAGGLQNAFQVVGEQSFGWLWLICIGGGFIAYGIYMFVAAVYRRYAVR